MNKKQTPKDFSEYIINETYKKINAPVYCRICGKDLKYASIENDKGNEEEIFNKMHYNCYKKLFMR
jgi:hypothetical protein